MSRSMIWLIILAVAAVALRIGFSLALGIGDEPALHTDQGDYVRYASNLVQGRGYVGPEPGSDGDVPTAYLPPGTPWLYAGTFALVGEDVAALRIVQALLGAGSVVLLWFLARAIFGEPVAWVAGIGLAVYPIALFYSHELLTETLYVFMVLAFALICVAWLGRRPAPAAAMAAGVVLGLTALVRPTILFFLPLFLLWALIVLPTWRTRMLIAPLLLVAGMVIAPWSAFATRTHGQFVLVSPTAWTVLIQGNNRIVATDPQFAGYSIWYTDIPEYAGRFNGLNQVQREVVARDLVLQWFRENPNELAPLAWAKARRFWSPFLQQDDPLRRLVMLVSWGGVLLLAIPAGLVTLITFTRQRAPGLWIHLFALAVFGQAILYFGLPRYRYPIEPLFILLAAATVVWIWNRIRARRPVPAPAAGAVLTPIDSPPAAV